MLGEILGLKAGEIAALPTLGLFLLVLPPRPCFCKLSDEVIGRCIPLERGVLSGANFGVFTDKVGVLSSSSREILALLSVEGFGGSSVAASGSTISSMTSSVSVPARASGSLADG